MPRPSSPHSRHIPTLGCFRSTGKWSTGRILRRRNAYWNDHDRRLTMATTAAPQTANASEATNQPTRARGWGTDAPDQPLRPMDFERRALRPNDVAIRITYAGICHSDLHTCRNDWHNSQYPVIPGHD